MRTRSRETIHGTLHLDRRAPGGLARTAFPAYKWSRPEERTSMNRLAAAVVVVVTLILSSVFERTATLLAAQAAAPDAVAADPARYTVLYENDVAVIIRVKFPAGAKSVMHSHPAGCAIFYKDATLKMTS